jgi:hypothetical protein
MTDQHIDPDSIRSVAKAVVNIAYEMPDGVSKGRNGVSNARAGNEETTAATALSDGFDAWADHHALLTRQVEGFGSDLDYVVATWAETEGTNTDVFTRYGEDL